MAWDNTKNTATDPDNPNADEQLTASEWNTHVDEGHWPGDELQFQINNGDPVLVNPQNSNEIVARYDRSKGSWVIGALKADEVNNNGNPITISDILDRSDVPKGTTTVISQALNDTDNAGAQFRTQPTDDVSTTQTRIIDYNSDQSATLVCVCGDEQGSLDRFYDLVFCSRDTGTDTISTLQQNSPDGRTYSAVAGGLELAMDANTYDVVATSLNAWRDNNATS